MFPSPRWELVTLTASSFLNKILLMSSRGHWKSTSVGKGRSWCTKNLIKSDIGWKGCNKKSDIKFFLCSIFSFFFCHIRWGCDSITVSYYKNKPKRLVICGLEKDARLRYTSNHRDVPWKWLLLNFDNVGKDTSNFCKILRK